ncbi:MAG: TatD family hydrolase [Firmicutes bacterium]|nr:TatD family hydrolase [Bacillota bacterium]
MFFDSHAHINNADYTEQDRMELLEAIERSSLDYVMDIGFDIPSSIMAAKHAAENDFVFAAVGCHPHDTKLMDEEGLDTIRQLTKQPGVKAIGEIGLDFHYDLSDRDIQREWFRRQIRLANELKMPIAIHSREADQETMDILVEEGAFSDERKSWFPAQPGGEPDARVLIHCFSGSAEMAKQYIKMGATISICGPVTYKNNKKTVAVVEAVPIDYILVETDSPYLAPVPMRGKPNVPMNVEYTAAKIAEIKGMTLEEVAARTKANAMRFYGI